MTEFTNVKSTEWRRIYFCAEYNGVYLSVGIVCAKSNSSVGVRAVELVLYDLTIIKRFPLKCVNTAHRRADRRTTYIREKQRVASHSIDDRGGGKKNKNNNKTMS